MFDDTLHSGWGKEDTLILGSTLQPTFRKPLHDKFWCSIKNTYTRNDRKGINIPLFSSYAYRWCQTVHLYVNKNDAIRGTWLAQGGEFEPHAGAPT